MKIVRYSLLFTSLPINSTYAQLWIDAETGVVLGTPYNKISIPNTNGTRFDLGKEFAITPIAYAWAIPSTTATRSRRCTPH
jgi:hypothetical protein